MARAPHLTTRLQGFGTTIFAEMSALAVRTGALNLGQGFPDTDGPPAVLDAAVAAIRSGHNQYPPGPGLPDLRAAVAEHQKRFWGLSFDPDTEVLITAGATEALAAALIGLSEIGDEIVVFDPTYDSYAAGIAMAGARMRGVLLRPPAADATGADNRYSFDPDELRAAFNPKTRLILLNTPHNPTGKVFTADELELIAELCQEHDVLAVTDEVYEHLVFDGGEHRPLAAVPGMADRTLTISSGGKTFSCTGWKIGWVCGPPELVAAVRTTKQYLTFVNGGPFQPAIATGLRLGDDYFTRYTADLQAKRDLLNRHLDAAGFTILPTEGTFFTTVDVTSVGATDSVEFCLSLPETAGVVAVPSAVFYQDRANGRHLARFCFAKTDDLLDRAGERLVEAFA
ncbi:MAG: pyridoxal phosphate-dependent aminotransferase [Actinomycetota bacterium]